ncbi:MAG TPA: lytic transglycosylase domain-containing protein [Acidobacteriaceae bacterium]|jgi:hypothetical protein
MEESGIFDEYLVKLGFDSDPAGYAKFASTLTDAAGIAASRTKSIVESLGKWQGAIVGGFAAIGTAALVTMDKVADADLGYQLLATKMFIGVDAAKQLSIATDVLGHSLDEIAWNPELHRRFDILLDDQKRMAEVMGHGYEPALLNIREIRFQFSRLQDELQFGLLPTLVSDVFDDLGGGNALQKLENLNDWVIDHLPEIASTFSKYLVPVLKDAKDVGSDVVGMLEDAGVAFTNLVGLISGDHSIEGTTLNFDHLLTAVDHVSHGFAKFVNTITDAERILAHLASGTALFFSGHYEEAAAEYKKAMQDFTAGSGAVLGGVVGTGAGAFGGSVAGGAIGTTIGATLGSVVPVFGTAAGGAIGGALGTAFGGTVGAVGGGITGAGGGALEGWWKQKVDPSTPEHGFYVPDSGIKSTSSGSIHDLIDSLASKYSIDPSFAHAVAGAESEEQQVANGHLITSNKGAQGIFQLEPGTAAQYGVDPSDPAGNIKGGLQLLADLGKKYNGNVEEVLAAYNWGQGHLDKAIARHGGFDTSYLPRETRDYIARIESRMGGDIHVSTYVYASPNQNAQEVGKQASDQTIAQLRARRQTTSNIAMLGSAFQ